MNRKAFLRTSILLAALLTGAACGSNDTTIAPPTDGRPTKRGEFALELTGLGDPSPSHYEAWFVVGGQPRSGGKFRVNAAGKVTDLAGREVTDGILRVNPADAINGATEFFISLEPGDDTSALPAPTRILGGAFSGASANLSVSHPRALGVSYSTADGSYFLNTPTTETVKDFNRGIVFTLSDCAAGARDASATIAALPELPAAGWSYEGWVTRPTQGGVIAYSTGRFSDLCDFDSDRAGQGAGRFGSDENGDGLGDGLAFPAQDFVDSSGSIPPLVLDAGGFSAAVSLEPEPDNSAAPFFLTVLDAPIPAALSDVTLEPTGLAPIGGGHFEMWHRTRDGVNLSIGKFRLDTGGDIVDLSGAPITSFTAGGDLLLSLRIFITVETEGDSDAIPSRSIMLSGAVADSFATLKPDTAVTNAIYDLSTLGGAYFLNTFTTADDTTDFDSGIWFYKESRSEEIGDSTTLALPVLRDGWVFEGWVARISTGEAYSTGRFLSTFDSDHDLAGATAGPDGIDINQDGRGDGPLFPGQEFVRVSGGIPGLLDLDGGDFRVFVTIEPGLDNDPGPFILPVMEDALIEPLGAFETQPLAQLNAPPPRAAVRISRGPVTRPLTNRASVFPAGRVTIGTSGS
ncbi:MAG: hypothetical protein ACKVU1_06185 [bacterium]